MKKRIDELLETILEGINCFEKNIYNQNNGILYDCVYALEYISTKIENKMNLIKILEGIIVKINFIINLDVSSSNIIDSITDLKVHIEEFKNIFNDTINSKLEMVFMPYKASMWDSFDSIYKEAKNDDECICYVVPIPYYEKDESGKFIRKCYEGENFPKHVEVTHYEAYDFEARKSDIIYIHNPYDNVNRITEIDNRYFSDKLLNYTDALIYVPYYIDGSYENTYEHKAYSICPAPINADRIITQSERHRELFVANGFNPDKVLNIGSPKFDAALLYCNDEVNIPKEWSDLCYGKKVFLLNTTIDDVLRNRNWINDVRNIMNCFMNSNNSVLIWRTHPLIDITLKTMIPNDLELYLDLVNEVMGQSNIIKDNDTDIYKCIKLSDALIGGYSSVTFQYIITGKPVLLLIDEDRLKKERIYCCDYLGAYQKCDKEDINKFIDMVVNGEDLEKNERLERLQKSITNGDGTCGQKIHWYIKNEVLSIMN